MPLFANPLGTIVVSGGQSILVPNLLANTIILGSKSFGPFSDIRGVFEASGFDRPYKWDIKDAPGTQGASITYRGGKPAEGKFKFIFGVGESIDQARSIDQFDRDIMPLFFIDATKTQVLPITVSNTLLQALGIFAVTTTKIGQYVHAGAGLWTIEMEMLEYKPAAKKNVTTTPTSTVTGSKKGNAPAQISTFEEHVLDRRAALLEEAKILNRTSSGPPAP